MAKDANELSATDEEIHADVATPPLPSVGSSNRKRARDVSSDEDDDDEDDISGERPAEGRLHVDQIVEECHSTITRY